LGRVNKSANTICAAFDFVEQKCCGNVLDEYPGVEGNEKCF
jgi:hypothetical protein